MNSTSAPETPQDQKEMRRVLKTMMLAAVALSALLLLGLWWMSQESKTTLLSGSNFSSDFTRILEKKPMPPLAGLEWRPQATLISFWAAWCAPCLEELPLLDQLAKDQSDLRIVLVNVDTQGSESLQQAIEFLKQMGHPGFDHVFAQSGSLEAWGFESLPVHFIVSAEKQVIWKSYGAMDWSLPELRQNLFQFIRAESKSAKLPPTESESSELPPAESESAKLPPTESKSAELPPTESESSEKQQ